MTACSTLGFAQLDQAVTRFDCRPRMLERVLDELEQRARSVAPIADERDGYGIGAGCVVHYARRSSTREPDYGATRVSANRDALWVRGTELSQYNRVRYGCFPSWEVADPSALPAAKGETYDDHLSRDQR